MNDHDISEYSYKEPISGCTFVIEKSEESHNWLLWYQPITGGNYRFGVECDSAEICAKQLGNFENQNKEWENLRERAPSLWDNSKFLLHPNIINLVRRGFGDERDIPYWVAAYNCPS